MAVFMNSGGGDIYGAETKEQCLDAMREDLNGEFELDEAFEVDGSMKMLTENEDGSIGPESTLEAEYTNLGYGYVVATCNY